MVEWRNLVGMACVPEQAGNFLGTLATISFKRMFLLHGDCVLLWTKALALAKRINVTDNLNKEILSNLRGVCDTAGLLFTCHK
jgi:hypothetical protein